MKNKNINAVIALWFAVAALLVSAFDIAVVFDRFPFSVTGVQMLLSELLTAVSAVMLLVGIIKKQRAALTASAIAAACCCGIKLLGTFFSLSYRITGYYAYRYVASYAVNNILFALIMVALVAFIMTAVYSSGSKSLKTAVSVLLCIAWFVLILTGSFAMAILTSAFVLLISYTNIMDVNYRVKVSWVVFLSVLTFGIYYIVWIASVFKKAAQLCGTAFKASSVVCFVLLWPYRVYKGYIIGEELALSVENIKDRSVVYLVLDILPLSVVTFALVQNDLNKIAVSDGEVSEEDTANPSLQNEQQAEEI